MARKTFDVAAFKKLMNTRILNAPTVEARQALAMALTDVLMQTDNYRGFGFVRRGADGAAVWGNLDGPIRITDESMVQTASA